MVQDKMQFYLILVFSFLAIDNVSADFKNVLGCGETTVPLPPSSAKIVGGRNASQGEHPWAAILGYDFGVYIYPTSMWYCGGSLITNKHVLTAAHCIVTDDVRLSVVRIGDLFYKDDPSEGAIDIRVKKAIAHEKYEGHASQNLNDIGIIYLEKAVDFTDLIIPICLPEKEDFNIDNVVGQTGIIAGWGQNKSLYDISRTDRLYVANLTIISNEMCEKMYPESNNEIPSSQFCAGATTGGTDTCKGDSGGPLMLKQGKKHFLFGITSYGKSDCGVKDKPGFYTNVSSYLDWIHTHITE